MCQFDLERLRETHRDVLVSLGFVRDCLGKTSRAVVEGCLISVARKWRAHLQREEDVLARMGRRMSPEHTRIHIAIFGAIDALIDASRRDTDIDGGLVGLANYVDTAIRYESALFATLPGRSADPLQSIALQLGAQADAG